MISVENPPYENESLNRIYELLYCDDASLFQPDELQLLQYPYKLLFASKPDIEALQRIAADATIESRLRILATRKLREHDAIPNTNDLMAVIVEVGLDDGLDVVAAYLDGTARYINHAEKIIFWDTTTPQSAQLVESIFVSANVVLEKIGPWNDVRPPHPRQGTARISLLAGGQLYFGQGLFNALNADPMAGPVIDAALQLMIFLTSH